MASGVGQECSGQAAAVSSVACFVVLVAFYLDIVFIVLVSNEYSHGNAVPCARVGLAGQL